MKKTGREFEKNSFMLFVLMMSANVCNYLFQIIMGNLMEVEQYAQAIKVFIVIPPRKMLFISGSVNVRHTVLHVILFIVKWHSGALE